MGALNDKINSVAAGTADKNPYGALKAELDTITVDAVFTVDTSAIAQMGMDSTTQEAYIADLEAAIATFNAAKASLTSAKTSLEGDMDAHYVDHWKSSDAGSPATSIKTNFSMLKACWDTKNQVNEIDGDPPIDYTSSDYYIGTLTVHDDFAAQWSTDTTTIAAIGASIVGGPVSDTAPVVAATSQVNSMISQVVTLLDDVFASTAANEIATYHAALDWLMAYGFVNWSTAQTDPEIIDKISKVTQGIV